MGTAVTKIEAPVTAEEFCGETRQGFHFSFCQGLAGFKEMRGTFILQVRTLPPSLQHAVSKAGAVQTARYGGVAALWGQGSST